MRCLISAAAVLLLIVASCEKDSTTEPPVDSAPDPPVLLQPAANEALSLPVLLHWEGSDRYEDFNVQVYKGKIDSAAMVCSETTDSTILVLGSLPTDATYLWRVGGLYNGERIWSEVASFTVRYSLAQLERYSLGFHGITVRHEQCVVRDYTPDPRGVVTQYNTISYFVQDTVYFECDSVTTSTITSRIQESGWVAGEKISHIWDCVAEFDPSDFALIGVEYTERYSFAYFGSGYQHSYGYALHFGGEGFRVPRSAGGVYRIEDPTILSTLFTFSRTYESSLSARTEPHYVTSKTTQQLGFAVGAGAFIELRFQ